MNVPSPPNTEPAPVTKAKHVKAITESYYPRLTPDYPAWFEKINEAGAFDVPDDELALGESPVAEFWTTPDPMPVLSDVPVGTTKTVTFNLERDLTAVASAELRLAVEDLDATAEAEIAWNSAKLAVSDALLSDGRVREAHLSIPLDAIKKGDNVLSFAFADNLGGTTAGYTVKGATLLLMVSAPKADPDRAFERRPVTSLPVRIDNPRTIPTWSLPAGRTALGTGYKPNLVLLPDGTLLLVALFNDHRFPGGKYREWTGLWRSLDGGRTWSGRTEAKGLIGREQVLTCTSRGTILATSLLLVRDANSLDDCITSWLHRSTDNGKTWQRIRATLDGDLRNGIDPALGSSTSPNVLELPDGTLLMGVSTGTMHDWTSAASAVAYLWKSTDDGVTWDKSRRIDIAANYRAGYGFFADGFLYRNDAGALLHWCRIGESPMYPMNDGRPVPTRDSSKDRMMWTKSADGGRTWGPLDNFGDYGSHFPRVIKLRDGRLLLTYTQRALTYPLGLRAVLSRDDGETWDFEHDRIVIEGRTPWGAESGGGFGNTVQLTDGTLVSCYSYNAAEPGRKSETRIEIVRWKLP